MYDLLIVLKAHIVMFYFLGNDPFIDVTETEEDIEVTVFSHLDFMCT